MPSFFHKSKPGDATSEHIEDKEPLVDKKNASKFYKNGDEDFPKTLFWQCDDCLLALYREALADNEWIRNLRCPYRKQFENGPPPQCENCPKMLQPRGPVGGIFHQCKNKKCLYTAPVRLDEPDVGSNPAETIKCFACRKSSFKRMETSITLDFALHHRLF
ncbi:hypothetical protein HYFRA_00012884 [Hymenoscyphus fraxineus]|uniref:Uncharacterized protein n=1 Tax=Hymenoscyphus fraxineus TaxID=746836 RepID=A0A9N9L8F7_9HELO|nr:hypothetical protein HYFRA_00012884 [Hymenoscyphus fraxineus]